jgi:hypothetical protein
MPDLGPNDDVEPDCYMRELDVSSVGESYVHATGCRHSRKHGHYVLVSATYIYRVTPYASETPVSGYQQLIGSDHSKHWYHQLRYIINMLAPVRLLVQQKQTLADTKVSPAEDLQSGSITYVPAM